LTRTLEQETFHQAALWLAKRIQAKRVTWKQAMRIWTQEGLLP